MIDHLDEQTVLHELRAQGENFAEVMDLERKAINKWAGLCSWTNVVPMKSQEILAFYGQALSLVRAILDRLR